MRKALLGIFVLVFFAACDDGATVKKPGPDTAAVTDTDDIGGDDLLNDDGQLINDDGQLINDDGQLVNDDFEPVTDDGEPLVDDGMVWPDDGPMPTDDGVIWPDDGPMPTDDGVIWPDDGPLPTDDGVIWPDDGPMPTDDDPIGPDDDTVTVTCGDNSDCKEIEYCKKPEGSCNTFLAGTCAERPQMCPPVYSPVCGCDGKTYSSPCDAAGAGVNVDYSGECGTEPGCYSDDECVDGSGTTKQFCLYEVGVCMGPGTCTEYPASCGEIYDPVCGCDMMTYENECSAQQAGVSVMYKGACEEEKFSTLYYYYDQATMNAPEAKVVIVNGEDEIEFIGADLMTRTPFTGGVYFRTTFYGLTDDGSQIEFQLRAYSIGWSIPKTITLDGSDNYARWTRLGPETVGELFGEVTIMQYARDNEIVTLMEVSGDALTFTPTN